jgi:hypothetical protein
MSQAYLLQNLPCPPYSSILTTGNLICSPSSPCLAPCVLKPSVAPFSKVVFLVLRRCGSVRPGRPFFLPAARRKPLTTPLSSCLLRSAHVYPAPALRGEYHVHLPISILLCITPRAFLHSLLENGKIDKRGSCTRLKSYKYLRVKSQPTETNSQSPFSPPQLKKFILSVRRCNRGFASLISFVSNG